MSESEDSEMLAVEMQKK